MVPLFEIETYNISKITIGLGASCQPSWMNTITGIHKNGYHDSTILLLGSIFNLNMFSAILDGSHYQKSSKSLSWPTIKDRDFE